MKSSRPDVLTLDVRPLIPSYRHSLIFAILEKLGEIGAPQALQVVSDHEPVGMRMELGMREETKGRYDFSCEQREDGSWLYRLERKED
jgi:uncharacterized protein (DUF2249 family)